MVSSYSSYETNKVYTAHIDENGTLSGYVKDTSMNPIEGAKVRVYFHETYEENYSDSSGYYHVTNIPICNCTKNATASKEGYRSECVLLSIDETTIHNFVLTPLGNTLYVGGSGPGNYSRIQDAIDNASDGDTIFVYNGIYYENLVIEKSICLMGESKDFSLIIDNFSHSSSAITIQAIHVTITNFTIRGEATSCGIEVNSNYSKIYNNNIFSSTGIDVNSANNAIFRNYIKADTFWAIGLSGSFNSIFENTLIAESCGIYLLFLCRNNTIRRNNITGRTSGIRLVESDGNIIVDNIMQKGGLNLQDSYNNIVLNNTVNGKPLLYLTDESNRRLNQDFGQIIIINCENITIENQNLYDVQTGIQLYRSKNCTIQNNSITHTDPLRGDGIEIICCENSKIVGNTFTYIDAIRISSSNNTIISYNHIIICRTGIFLKYCDVCEISNNNIVNNSLCIEFYFGSKNSIITMNNLIGNPPYALFIDPINANNTWYNNYWGRARILPKPIRGALIIKDEFPFPTLALWIKFDFHPVQEPYDAQ